MSLPAGRAAFLSAAVVVAGARPSPVVADVIDWLNPAGGSFSDPGNWAGGAAPGTADTASFALGATYAVDAADRASFGPLAFSDGSITFVYGGSPSSSARTTSLVAIGGAAVSFVPGLTNTDLELAEVHISAGAVVTGGLLRSLPGTAHRATVSGAGSTWSVRPNVDLLVGDPSGASHLSINGGGALQTRSVALGNSTSLSSIRSAWAAVDGVGSTWTATGHLLVGADGGGSLAVTSGGRVDLPFTNFLNTTVVVVGYRTPTGPPASLLPTAYALVDGTGSQLNSLNGQLRVGDRMNGRLDITNGGVVRSRVGESTSGSSGIIGLNGGSGTVTVRGEGSVWDAFNGTLRVGLSASSPANLLHVADGGRVVSRYGDIYMNSTTATLNRAVIEGAGSRWTTDYLGVGGVLEIRDGGSVVAGAMEVGTTSNSFFRSLVEFHAGELSVGTLDVSSGHLRLAGPVDKAVLARRLQFPTGAAAEPRGRLDLGGHAAVVDYEPGASPLAALTAEVARGRAGGDWSGTGITSSAAAAEPGRYGVGIAEAADVGLGSVAGIALDATVVVVRYTLLGDANLDRGVDVADFGRLAASFNGLASWSQGDFDYDGTAGIGDFSLLAGNFNRTVARAPASAAAAVPEPAGGGVLAAATVLVAGRRRRRST